MYGDINYVNKITGFAFDYFLKDHLGNVRMVLTEEQKPVAPYRATMELAANDDEAKFFDKIPETRYDKPDDFDGEGSNLKVSKLFGTSTSDKRMGPGVVLKVMAGDKFTAKVFGWYQPGTTDITQQSGLSSIATGIISTLTGGIAGFGKTGATEITSSGILNAPISQFLPSQPSPPTGAPRAYLNWVVLDEAHFKLVTGNYGAIPVPAITAGQNKQLMEANTGNQITVNKNGYLYVFVSNESKGNVYFDDLLVEHFAGAILEETHYYPFGLTMAGISSKAAGSLTNKYKFGGKELNSNEFSDGSGLEQYDFNARMYNVQIGRWNVLDPFAHVQLFISPYAYALNSPLTYADRDGRLPIFINGRVASSNERADKSYWDDGILSAISNSGIANPGSTRLFVDGDRWYGKSNFGWKYKVRNGDWTNGNVAYERILAGYSVGKKDIGKILSNLAKDPTTGKYTETIQIYTHSRGAAFGSGYISAILEYVKDHPEQFADPKKVIDLVYNMAPHQSDDFGDPGNLMAFSHDHTRDMLSGNDMGGLKAAFKSNETSPGATGSHSTTSFVRDITAFLSAFVSSNGDSDLLIKNFVNTMKEQYGIKVKVSK